MKWTKAVHRDKFIPAILYLKKKSQINNLNLYLEILKKGRQTIPKVSRKKRK